MTDRVAVIDPCTLRAARCACASVLPLVACDDAGVVGAGFGQGTISVRPENGFGYHERAPARSLRVASSHSVGARLAHVPVASADNETSLVLGQLGKGCELTFTVDRSAKQAIVEVCSALR